MEKKLYRSKNNKMIAGVCAGLGEYFDIDPTVVRIIVLITLFTGAGFIGYIVCAIVIPENPISDEANNTTNEYSSDNNEYSRNNNAIYDENQNHRDGSNSRNILGIFLIGLGAFIIFQRFFHWFDFDWVWPIGIILIGLLIIFKRK